MREFLVLGSIILVGFLGQAVFRYTKIPESLFMIIIGLVVGPGLGIVNPTELAEYTALIVNLTLIIVLLDSGLCLNVVGMARRFAKAVGFTLLVLVFSLILIGGALFLLGWNPIHALLLGVVSSGSTTIVVTSVLTRLSVPGDIKQILILESIINDVTLVTAAVILIQLLQLQSVDTVQVVVEIIRPILVSFLVGSVFAIIWVYIIWRFYKGAKLIYCFTLGLLFLLYFAVDLLNGNGAIAVLVLSLMVGNQPALFERLGRSRFFRRQSRALKTLSLLSKDVVDSLNQTQVDFAFFIKNFFFVYLGVIFDVSEVSPLLTGLCLLILALMFLSRFLSARIAGLVDATFHRYSWIISAMVARGFTATFVALLPSTMGIEIPQLKELILMLVLVSIIPTIVASILFEQNVARNNQ